MKYIFFLLLTYSLFACNTKNGIPFTVEGKIKNAPQGTVFLEQSEPDGSRPVMVDSAQISKDGSFSLHTTTEEEKMFSLRSGDQRYPFAFLINDNRKVNVEADLSSPYIPYKVKGSPASQEKIDFDSTLYMKANMIVNAARNFDSLSKPAGNDSAVLHTWDSTKNIRFADYQSAVDQAKNYVADFVDQTKSAVLVLYALQAYKGMTHELGLKGFTPSEEAGILTKAVARFPDHKTLAAQKNNLRSTKAPDFTLPDTSGRQVSLSSFKGKYVLVDFWASWCQPCRMENPNVVAAYNQFRNKNFTILGVSLDKNKDAWIQAINADGLTWNHVSDLKFWNSEVASLYGVNSIPYNFLLDPQGNIIAEDIRGKDLISTLQQVLK